MNKSLMGKGLLLGLVFLCMAPEAGATFPTLAQRLPPSSNAIVAVNVARLVKSPYGKSAGWGERLADAWAKQPMMIPPGAQRLIMAASVKPSSMESNWEMSLIEMDRLPSLQALARDEGGHIDRVWETDAVVSPINAYFVPLPGNVLASITPAERSEIARWVRQPVKPEGVVTSVYIKAAVAALSEQTDIVMAMDLEGAYGVPNIRKWLDQSNIKGLNLADLDPVSRILGTMNGITLEIRVDDKISGKATVDFDRDARPLQNFAKPIMLEMLSYVGMKIDEVPDWTFTATGQKVTMQGPLSDTSLRRLLSIVQSPIPAATVEEPPAGGRGDAQHDTITASQKYYKTICVILDSMRSGASVAESTTWVRSAAKRIDQLPILHVDPALVEWGAMVSARLKQAGGVLGVGQTQINARVSGVMDPSYGDDVSANAAASENARKQRQQVAMEQRAQTQEQALNIINSITETRPVIRAQMVAKYNVEF